MHFFPFQNNAFSPRRIAKERVYYEKEIKDLEAKLQKLIENKEADEYVVRKQREVLQVVFELFITFH